MPDEKKYVFMSVKAIRGREATKIAEHQNRGWELVDQSRGVVQTTLNFRRERPTMFGSKAWAAFRELDTKTQLRVGVGAAGLVVALVLAGVIASVLGGNDERAEASAAQTATRTTTQRPTGTQTPTAAVTSQSASATSAPSPSTTSKLYVYTGPRYQVVTIDEDVSNAHLNQYWVYTKAFDYSKSGFRKQVKAIITDVAHREGSDKVIVNVVTDKEIIAAESNATIKSFMDEKGMDYFTSVIAPKEKTDWVAMYVGGFDGNEAKPSDADDAFEISWLAEKIEGVEKWKPRL
jgi:hypothetical protein